MNKATQEHPKQEDLAAFALGCLDPAAIEQLGNHLADCPECRDTVKNTPADTFVSLIRDCETMPETPDRPEPENGGNTIDLPSQASENTPPRSVDLDARTVDPAMSGISGMRDTPKSSEENTLDIAPDLLQHQRYEILGLLGQGGIGIVYKAEHRMMQRTVALKVIHRQFVAHQKAVDRFHREVQAAARLQHPNIVTAFDAEQAGDTHFLVMEFVPGMDLDAVLKKKGPLPIVAACHFIRQAALGLQHAFEQGMVHRDIKPQNLMLTGKNQIKILDFGLASLSGEGSENAALTQDGAIMGTPDYIAPEQARDAHSADIRADIYSLGCTFYRLLTGQVPFPEGKPMAKILAHVNQTPTPARELRADLPVNLGRVLNKMMAKDPAQRYQTPAEVARALTPFVTKKPVQAGPINTSVKASGPPSLPKKDAARTMVAEGNAPTETARSLRNKPAPTPPRRGPHIAFLAGAAAFLLLILGGVVFYLPTSNGLVRIEINDPEIKVSFKGNIYTFHDKKGETITVTPGEHSLTVERGELKFETPKFMLGRGENPALRVEFVKGSLTVKMGNAVVAERPLPAPAVAATGEWALEFDGKDDYVKLPTFLKGPKTKDLTVEAWVTFADFATGSWVQNVISGDWSSFIVGVHNTQATWRCRVNNEDFPTTEKITAEKRMHVALVMKANSASLYLDGRPIGNKKLDAPFRPATTQLFLGCLAQDQTSCMHGKLHAVRFSSTPRYKGNFTPQRQWKTDKETLALYHFDEGQGTTLKDSSGNGYDGTIYGAKWVRADGVSAPPAPESGWVQLFNGKDLTGWEHATYVASRWSVENGNLVATGNAGMAFKKPFKNFHCRVETKISGNVWGAVHFRRTSDATLSTCTVIADRFNTGGIWFVKDGQNQRLFNPLKDDWATPDTWLTVEIIVVGKEVTILVNGTKTAELKVEEMADEGRFMLTSAREGTTMTVRKFEVKELPSEPAPRGTSAHILTSDEYEWTEPVNLGPQVNSKEADYCPWVSADGLTLLFSSNRSDGVYDIWQCKRSSIDEDWGNSTIIGEPITSPSFDVGAELSSDGCTMVFVSTRKGGEGDMDLWMATRESADAPWRNPVNLGANVNSRNNDSSPALSANGLQLVFDSKRGGRFQSWITTRKSIDDKWAAPELFFVSGNRGTIRQFLDSRITLLYSNGKEIYLTRWNDIEKRWANDFRLPAPINGNHKNARGFFCRATNTIYFESDRPGGQGKLDLWMSQRVKKKSKAKDEITLVREFDKSHPSDVVAIEVTPDGRHVLSGSAQPKDGSLLLHEVATGKLVHSFKEKEVTHVFGIAIARNGQYAVVSDRKSLFVFDLPKWKLIRKNEADEDWLKPIFGVAISHDNKHIFSGHTNGSAAVWDLETGEKLARIQLDYQCYAGDFLANGKVMLAGLKNSGCQLWDWKNKKIGEPFPTHPVHDLAISSDGRWMLLGGFGNMVRLYDLQTKKSWDLQGHKGTVRSVEFLPDGKHCVSCGHDGTLRLWSLASKTQIASVSSEKGQFNHLAVTPDGRHVVTGGGWIPNKDGGESTGDFALRLWQLPESVWPKQTPPKDEITLIRKFEGHTGPVKALDYSSDGKFIASGSGYKIGDKTARIWNAHTGELIHKIDHSEQVMSVAFSPNNDYLLTGTWDGKINLWDIRGKEGKLAHFLAHCPSIIDAVAFSPDGQIAYAGGKDNVLGFDVKTGKPVAALVLEGPKASILQLAVTGDGRHLLAATRDSHVYVWELTEKKLVRYFPENLSEKGVAGVGMAVLPDGQILVSFGPKLRLANWTSGKVLFETELKSHAQNVVASPDGRFAYLACGQDLVATVDLKTWKIQYHKAGDPGGTWDVALSPDGTRIVSCGGFFWQNGGKSGDFAPRLWQLPESVWPKAAATAKAEIPWRKLFDGATLNNWTFPGGDNGDWKISDGAITCSGPTSHLYTKDDQFGDFHLRLEAKINDGGNGGVYFRTGMPLKLVGDYEAQINSTAKNPKTGSLYRASTNSG